MSTKWNSLYGVLLLSMFIFPPAWAGEEEWPDTVILDSISQYYEPVVFDHALHVELIASNECAICHHHTLGTPVLDPFCHRCHDSNSEASSVACRDCHPAKRFSAAYLAFLEEDVNLYHVEKPGFQGAVHQCCMGCHEKREAPTGCQDCHARTDEGDKFYYSGAYAPKHIEKTSGH